MRYFKCENVLNEQSLSLTKEEKKIVRKEKTLNAIATIVFLVVSIICALCGAFTIMQIPVPNNVFLR